MAMKYPPGTFCKGHYSYGVHNVKRSIFDHTHLYCLTCPERIIALPWPGERHGIFITQYAVKEWP